MMMKILIPVAYMAFGVCVVQGASVTHDDFEAYTVGQSLNNVGTWREKNYTANQGAFVVAENSTLSGGSRAIHYVDTDAADSGSTSAQLRNKFGTTTHEVVITFDFLAITDDGAPYFNLLGAAGNLVRLNLIKGSNVRYKDSAGTTITLSSTLELNTWYTYTIKTDMAANSWGLTISDGTTKLLNASGLDMNQHGHTSVNESQFTVNLSPGSTGADYYIDNYDVSEWTGEPEPASIGLVVITGTN